MLLDYVASINGLVAQPQFYNALVDNCTTSVRRHREHVDPDAPPIDGVCSPTATWTGACTNEASSTHACPSKSFAG
jgi:hypothetical protein